MLFRSYSIYLLIVPLLLENVSILTILFYNSGPCAVIFAIFMTLFESPTLPTGGFCICMIIVICVCVIQNNLVVPFCLKEIAPSVFAILMSLSIGLCVTYQYTFMKEINPGHGNWVEVLGCVLCLLGSVTSPVWHILKSYREQRKLSSASLKENEEDFDQVDTWM